MDKQKTGELIKQARTKKGYTQSELGDLIGVSNKAVSRWENGESFPDIGLLENLSEILGLRIQDIVIGKAGENNDNVVTEVVRTAKLQEKEKCRKYATIGVGLILFCCLFIIGYWSFDGNSSGIFQTTAYYYLLAVILLFVSIKCVLDKKTMNPFQNRISKWISIVSIIIGIYVIIAAGLTIWIARQGKMPFNMELSTVGPFLNHQLIVIFIINIVALIIEYFRAGSDETSIHFGTYISIAVLHLALVYSDLLHLLSTFEQFNQMFICGTITVLTETIIAVIAVVVIKKNKSR